MKKITQTGGDSFNSIKKNHITTKKQYNKSFKGL